MVQMFAEWRTEQPELTRRVAAPDKASGEVLACVMLNSVVTVLPVSSLSLW
jgi:hypothetical protein